MDKLGRSLSILTVVGVALASLFTTGCVRAPILKAASFGQDAEVAAILAQGANTEAKFLNGCAQYPSNFHLSRAGKETPLICAAINGHLKVTKMLLDADANIQAQDFLRRSALYYAKALGHVDIEDLLVSRGARDGGDHAASLSALAPRKTFFGLQQQWGAPPPAPVAKTRPAARTAPSARRIKSDVDVPGYKSQEREDDFAIVVGIDSYKDLPKAKFAERDAETMRKHLVAMGYPERQVVLLKGANATRSGLQKYLEEWLPRNVTPASNVFFYYSGHGAPDTRTGKAYLVPWDGDASFLKSTAYPVEQLYASLNGLKAKQVIVALDACFSGAGGRSVLADGARPLVTEVKALAVPKGRLVAFTAASSNEITTTIKEHGHGIFTYYFLKGIKGAAQDKNGQVTAKSLFKYLKPKVQREARLQNREQTPTVQYKKDILLRSR